ncbi:F1F0 ATP synthase subunit F [Saccharomycopsis crataegensis]|uniref:F1F0 ATP synthase subunit F n=1 Tax=Saccharomycopsis crataegensis TaxID=43959 RepID=A0AAV5QTX0_9ASCO|nr:F1F0 ATP synthase subunit F [Saccharomycopsis crataegensis]
MSFVARRQLSTLIPPKIASVKNLGANPNAKRMNNVVAFYKALPQGKAAEIQPRGVIGRYRAKYFDGDNASGKPIFHLALTILIGGYSLEYYFHHAAGGHH